VANPPVVVSTCAVTDLYDSAISPELGPPIAYRMLQLTFTNTDESIATQVSFDVVHRGAHTGVTDRGRFSKGVAIEHTFDDDFSSGYGRAPDVCTVAATTFADGRRWTAPSAETAMLR
jgi:hypothetical protein